MTKVYIIDVGHGNASVIRDGNSTIVIDTGLGSRLLEFLEEQKIFSIDYLLLSHSDKDHIGGAINLIASEQFKVNRVFLNSDSKKQSTYWLDLAYTAKNSISHTKIRACLTPDESEEIICETASVEILAPDIALAMLGPGSKTREGKSISSNTISAVIRVTSSQGQSILFTGDLDYLGLTCITTQSNQLSSDVLVFPHHGGLPGTGSDQASKFATDLLTLVNPQTIIFSIRQNASLYPRPEIIKAILAYPQVRRIMSTCRSGAMDEAIVNSEHHIIDNGTGTIEIDMIAKPADFTFNLAQP